MGEGAGVTHPFDALADRYDAEFTQRPLGRLLREPVRRRLAEAFAPGHHVLEREILSESVIAAAILGEVVGSNAVAAVPGPDLTLAIRGAFFVDAPAFELVQP